MTKLTSVTVRELVLNILLEVLEEGQYSSAVLHNTLMTYQYFNKTDRAFLSRLSEGTIERALELDYIINQFSKVKVKKMKPVIRNILRMGVYQIKYMEQVPDRAACSEAVKLTQKKGFHTLKGFVNGVLRNIARNISNMKYPQKEENPIKYLSISYSMPEWIVQFWLSVYEYEIVEKMLRASLQEKATTLRCNLNQISVEEFKKLLEEKDILVKKGSYLPNALKVEHYNYINKIPGYQEGYFSVQDESSMLVALAADVKKNDYVVDVCAAPGGKSLHIAELLQGTGFVSARDLTQKKVDKICENRKRLQINNMEEKVWDALRLDEASIGKADIVIADLPCSGLGVIGKKNDIKYKLTKEGLTELEKLQREMLKVAAQYVKKGGVLIYSTCTVNPKENIENAKWFAKESGFVFESLDAYLPKELRCSQTQEGYLQLLPGIHQSDGFFLARLKHEKKF